MVHQRLAVSNLLKPLNFLYQRLILLFKLSIRLFESMKYFPLCINFAAAKCATTCLVARPNTFLHALIYDGQPSVTRISGGFCACCFATSKATVALAMSRFCETCTAIMLFLSSITTQRYAKSL